MSEQQTVSYNWRVTHTCMDETKVWAENLSQRMAEHIASVHNRKHRTEREPDVFVAEEMP